MTNNILLAINFVGIFVPGIVFIFSFVVTYLLYKHFTKKSEE
ncbi:hypothetical protein ACFL4T_06085 [candidate division KSB1 bacterium]